MEKTEIPFKLKKKKLQKRLWSLESITGDMKNPTGHGPEQPAHRPCSAWRHYAQAPFPTSAVLCFCESGVIWQSLLRRLLSVPYETLTLFLQAAEHSICQNNYCVSLQVQLTNCTNRQTFW